ncbi:BBE domain-containing protein [Streptomyces sp. NPDC085946]|uniref:BBE domain-containing protein n=1 Tax=Streptomyces sp. NPDC085946 TaxID=3365744 RepID=UPI0037D679DB
MNSTEQDEERGRVRSAHRDHYDRLARVKWTYAPHDLFHADQNIEPAAPQRLPPDRTPGGRSRAEADRRGPARTGVHPAVIRRTPVTVPWR